MNRKSKSLNIVLTLILFGGVLLAACAGPITIDVGGGGGDGGGTGDTGSVSSQTLFLLMIVLLVAMFAMILVAVSR